MTCTEVEILLCDYVDGNLHGAQKSALDGHLAACAGCAGLLREVQAAVNFMERAASADPPPELMTRILHEIPVHKQSSAWRRLLNRWFGGRFESLLQPRYAMGMAMTVLSFSMIARFAHIQPRQLHASDLDPVKVWTAVDDRAHRVWNRAMKSYENLRWVVEIQSRVSEWSEQDQEAQKAAQKK